MAEKKPHAHVADNKKTIVKQLEKKLLDCPIIGAINIENLPAAALARMRSKLRGKLEIFMTKRRLIAIAINNVKDKIPGLDKLQSHLLGMPALLFTRENPFSVYKNIKKSKSKAHAKAGQVAPFDIIVPAGPTSFTPGPIISELANLGIKTKVMEGKLQIMQDSTVVKEGGTISAPLASMMMRLGIKPMEIGLNITAMLEKGVIYTRNVLDIDEKAYLDNIASAARHALNLSVFAGIVTTDNREVLIQKAYREARGLGIETAILAHELVGDILARVNAQAAAVQSEAKL